MSLPLSPRIKTSLLSLFMIESLPAPPMSSIISLSSSMRFLSVGVTIPTSLPVEPPGIAISVSVALVGVTIPTSFPVEPPGVASGTSSRSLSEAVSVPKLKSVASAPLVGATVPISVAVVGAKVTSSASAIMGLPAQTPGSAIEISLPAVVLDT